MRQTIVVAAVIAAMSGALLAAERDQHGSEHAWAGATGSYMIVDFAAAWCQPCWRSLPHLEQLAKNHPQIRVLVIDVDETVAGRDRLVQKLKLTLPVIWDEQQRIAKHYDPKGMPATFVVDPKGRVVFASVGFNQESWSRLEKFVGDLSVE